MEREGVHERPVQVLQALPHLARRAITFDRGTEFTDWPSLQASIGMQTWFLRPAIALAARHGRKHQSARAKMAFEGG